MSLAAPAPGGLDFSRSAFQRKQDGVWAQVLVTVMGLVSDQKRQVQIGHTEEIRSLLHSLQERRKKERVLATVTEGALRNMTQLNAGYLPVIRLTGTGRQLGSMAFSHDETSLCVGIEEGHAKVYQFSGKKEMDINIDRQSRPLSTIFFEPGAQRGLVGILKTGDVVYWDPKTNTQRQPLTPKSSKTQQVSTVIRSLCGPCDTRDSSWETPKKMVVNAGGTQLAILTQGGKVGVLDETKTRILLDIQGAVADLAISKDHLVIALDKGKIIYWCLSDNKAVDEFEKEGALAFAISDDGDHIAVATETELTFWSPQSKKWTTSKLELSHRPCAMTFSPTASHIAVGMDDGAIQVFQRLEG